jgi:DNA-binding CsgD family transcriptional regulator
MDLAPGSLTAAYASTAVALLELGAGRPEAAAERLERIGPKDEPSLFDWRADLVEAYARSGRTADATLQLAALQRHAEETRRRSALAVAARCRGLLAPSARLDDEFGEALRYHGTLPTPFERARTELCYGERLRRARRRGDATGPLRSALATFTHLGAIGWSERARRELAATRGRSGAGEAETSHRLTGHELRVGSLVQRGARNREIATALYVSERTVEYHLTNIYRKLNLRSRTELAQLLSSRSR